jgi:hypothetical protein
VRLRLYRLRLYVYMSVATRLRLKVPRIPSSVSLSVFDCQSFQVTLLAFLLACLGKSIFAPFGFTERAFHVTSFAIRLR